MQKLEKKNEKTSIDLTGGDSVYCINESQMRLARKLMEEDASSHVRMTELFNSVVGDLSRNEQAALAFMLIDHLNSTPR